MNEFADGGTQVTKLSPVNGELIKSSTCCVVYRTVTSLYSRRVRD